MKGLPALSRGGYDHAVVRRTDEKWLDRAWEDARVLVLDADNTVPIFETDAGPRLDFADATTSYDGLQRIFLGVDGGVPYFAVMDVRAGRDVTQPDELAPGQRRAGLRTVGADLDDVSSGLLTAATALRNWHLRHPRCPRCGTPTEIEQAGWARRCPNDGSEHFPRTDPAVIMLIHDGGDRCVLGRQAVWPEGRYSILAGYVDPGEPAEAAVAREVDEEVGIAVTDVRYHASQPWPFPGSLMLGFSGRVEGADTLHVDHAELQDAQWFTREEIRQGERPQLLPSPTSIAYWLLQGWLDGDPSF